jgi:UPF0042 nucleotide-binding protein
MRFVIVTGMSGAGKTTAMKVLEDVGYFCVDNLPIALIQKFAELSMRSSATDMDRVALGVDIRSGDVSELENVLDQIHSKEILFMDASDESLIKRFKETRRSHPLVARGRVDEGIALERKELEALKKRADYIIETDKLLTRELRQELENIFVNNKEYKNLFVTVLSFGFKYGIPSDADLVFDVRFMPNPYYEPQLRSKTGNDEEIQKFVMDSKVSVEFMEKLEDMIKFLIPNYIAEGKNQLVVSIGCTGGKHRSVTVANQLYERLKQDADYGLKIMHRDIRKE